VGFGDRIRRPWKVAALLAVGAAGGGAALAVASVPDSNGVIHACYELAKPGSTIPSATGANLRIIDSDAGETCSTGGPAGGPTGGPEATLNFNQSGPPGPAGAQGATGGRGPAGARGPAGPTLTVDGGSTLTLPNREVITVGGSYLAAPIKLNTRPLGTVTITGLGKAFSFSIYGFSFSGATTGTGTGKVRHQPVTVVKETDNASPTLLKALTAGEVLKSADVVITNAGAGETATYELSDVVISSVQTSAGGARPTETISFVYAELKLKFTKQK
jgi:hypothetical protein